MDSELKAKAREKRERERALMERLAADEDFMEFLAGIDDRINAQAKQLMLSAPSSYDQRDMVYLSGQMSLIESIKSNLRPEQSNGHKRTNAATR